MRVLLLRHGLAHDRKDPACPADAVRALTDEGRKKTRRAMRGLKALGGAPTRILTSPFLRAQETAAIAQDVLGVDVSRIITTDALLPETPPYALFHALFAYLGTDEEVLCVGHAPHLDRIVALALTGSSEPVTSMKKAGACGLDLLELPRPRGSLQWFMPPKALMGLGD